MNKKKIKRIIAREGLIILSIIFLAILTRIVPYSIVMNEKTRPVDLFTEKRVEITDSSTGTKYSAIVKKDFDIFDHVDSEKNVVKFIKTAEIVKKEIVGLNDKLLFIVFLIYPFYLLIRFIIWAVETLRDGE